MLATIAFCLGSGRRLAQPWATNCSRFVRLDGPRGGPFSKAVYPVGPNTLGFLVSLTSVVIAVMFSGPVNGIVPSGLIATPPPAARAPTRAGITALSPLGWQE